MPLEDLVDYSGLNQEIQIQTVTFGEGYVEIQYMEQREQSENAGLIRSIVVKKSLFANQVVSILSDLEEIIEGGLLAIRNPEPSFDPRQRLAAAASLEDEDTDEG